MPKNQSIHIIGAGLIGLSIASRIEKFLSDIKTSSQILVHDQAASILDSWNSKLCGEYHINNGFHGVEMPRAQLAADFLNECGCIPLLDEAPNHRLLHIEDKELLFNTSIGDWPTWLRSGLDDLLLKYSRTQQPCDIISDAIHSTRIGESILQCHDRFSSDIEQCWHLFFPWFFPSEFCFQTDDEGGGFQDSVRTNAVSPSYLFPKGLIFDGLRPPIFDHLRSRNIDFALGNSLSFDDLEELSSSSEDRIVWCASSFGLLKALNKSLAMKCILGTRHMHLALYTASGKAISALKERLGLLPTEILVLNSEVPELNRLSFLDYQSATSDQPPSFVLLVAEYLTNDRRPNDDVCSRIKAHLERQLCPPVELVGQVYGRPMHTLDTHSLGEATSLIENYASEKCMYLPYIYYGPINMAKCAIIAKEFAVRSLL